MGKIAMIRADIDNPPGLVDLQNFYPGYKSIILAPIMKREAGECLWQERTTFQVETAHRTAGQDVVSDFLEHVHIPAFQVSKMDDGDKSLIKRWFQGQNLVDNRLSPRPSQLGGSRSD
jgi:hypothetical protein